MLFFKFRYSLLAQSSVSIDIINKIKAEKKESWFYSSRIRRSLFRKLYTLPNGKSDRLFWNYSFTCELSRTAKRNWWIKIVKLFKPDQLSSGDENEQPNMNSLMDERLTARLYSNIPNPLKSRLLFLFHTRNGFWSQYSYL